MKRKIGTTEKCFAKGYNWVLAEKGKLIPKCPKCGKQLRMHKKRGYKKLFCKSCWERFKTIQVIWVDKKTGRIPVS